MRVHLCSSQFVVATAYLCAALPAVNSAQPKRPACYVLVAYVCIVYISMFGLLVVSGHSVLRMCGYVSQYNSVFTYSSSRRSRWSRRSRRSRRSRWSRLSRLSRSSRPSRRSRLSRRRRRSRRSRSSRSSRPSRLSRLSRSSRQTRWGRFHFETKVN